MRQTGVLIIGGGIAGIQASLDLANGGTPVVLLDHDVSIGGKMAALDKNFPTLDCSICIEAPKISEVGEHPLIEVLAASEVVSLVGEPGSFRAGIRQRRSHVSDECTRCNDCVTACPQFVPDEFDEHLRSRRAIYTPFAQAVPGAYFVDMESCLNEPPNYLPCQRCVDACMPKCIDFSVAPVRYLERDVGAVIVATGFETMDISEVREYGYGTHPDVVTSMEVERLLNSAGPTGGQLVRPSDALQPRRMLFVLCVGSRDHRHFPYCSRFCCMYSIKQALQAKDHGAQEVSVLYMDVRAYGKGFEGFWERAGDSGIRFIRGRPAWVRAGNEQNGLRVRYSDTLSAQVREEHFDMVVLAGAVKAPGGTAELADALGVELDRDGFYRTDRSDGALLASSRPGVFLAGCAAGPKDIADSVAEASGAAAAAAALLGPNGEAQGDAEHAGAPEIPVHREDDARVGVILCHCGSNIAGTIDMAALQEATEAMTDVAHVERSLFACAGNAQGEIAELVRDKGLNRLAIAACSPTTHQPTFRRVCGRAGLNPYLMNMINLRNHDSWVHKDDPRGANEKAIDMVRMGVEQARRFYPLTPSALPVTRRILVIGGGLAGMTAATHLARKSYAVHLVEKADRLGGQLLDLHTVAPGALDATKLLQELAFEVERSGVDVHLGTEVEEIGGHVGQFHARLTGGRQLEVGAVILAMGARSLQASELGYQRDPRVVTNLELEGVLDRVTGERVTFVACVGSRQGSVGCSRYCCESMIQQALTLRRQGKQVSVLYRDIRTQGRHGEELYDHACSEGVRFFRFDPIKGGYPEWDDGMVRFTDELLGRRVALPTDLLVAVVGLRPVEESVAEQLRVPRSEDGFLLERHPKLGPAEVGKPGIYLAGTVQGPKGVQETGAQALAAASKASVLLARDVIEKEPIVAQIDPDKCTGCALCVPVCPFNAIQMVPAPGKKRGVAVVTEAACEGCGTCAATCNAGAITTPYFTQEQILAQIDAALLREPERKAIVFTCNWCSYAGADQAGIEKRSYPASVRLIRTMCSGRVEEAFVDRAFSQGAGAVMVSGCHPGDCHYLTANEWTQKRVEWWRRRFKRKGIEPERIRLEWVSAAEGRRFATLMTELDSFVAQSATAAPKEGHA